MTNTEDKQSGISSEPRSPGGMASSGSCCSPARSDAPDPRSVVLPSRVVAMAGNTSHAIEQVSVPGQTFQMGDSNGIGNAGDGEWPVHAVHLADFQIIPLG